MSVYGAPFDAEPGSFLRLEYSGRPSPFFKLRQVMTECWWNLVHSPFVKNVSIRPFAFRLQDYCVHVHQELPNFPENFEDLEALHRCKFVYYDGNDVDEVKFYKRNAVGFYMHSNVTDLKQLVFLLDDFVKFRVQVYPIYFVVLLCLSLISHNLT